MLSFYASVGKWRGFHLIPDGPTLRVHIGWLAICFAKTDFVRLVTELLTVSRDYNKVKPHIKKIEDRILKTFDELELGAQREAELQDQVDTLSDEVDELKEANEGLRTPIK